MAIVINIVSPKLDKVWLYEASGGLHASIEIDGGGPSTVSVIGTPKELRDFICDCLHDLDYMEATHNKVCLDCGRQDLDAYKDGLCGDCQDKGNQQ
jgi:hypothetical protein